MKGDSHKLITPGVQDYPDHVFSLGDPRSGVEECAYAYFRTNPLQRSIFLQRLRIALDMLPSNQVKRVLDAGTGIGFFLPSLANRAEEVWGVDYSQIVSSVGVMLQRRRLGNVQVGRADVTRLPFRDGVFDALVCLSVMEHVPEPQDAFAELSRVCKPGATCVVGWPIENAFVKFARYVDAKVFRRSMYRRLADMTEHGETGWHVTIWRDIEGAFERHFHVQQKKTIRIAMLPVYRMLKLVKLAQGP